MSGEKKETFRNGLRDFVEEKGSNFSKADGVILSRLMTEFYVSNVLRYLNPMLVPGDDDDLRECIVDGKNDLDVDFISCEDGRVTIIQTKYHRKNVTEDREGFESFCGLVERLYARHKAGTIDNDSLAYKLLDVDWASDEFRLRYICLGKGNQEILRREEEGQKPIPGLVDIEDRVSIEFLDETDLNKEYRSALQYDDQLKVPVDIIFTKASDNLPWLKYENLEGRRSYIGFISGGQLLNLLQKASQGASLFAMNIRNYLGEIATNKQIIQTALNEPEEFFFYNNGISAVSSDISEFHDERRLQCKQFSIINGAQTVNSIKKAIQRGGEKGHAREVCVIIRISEIDYSRDLRDGGFLDKVTKYNNTQNSIKLPDFRSNDPVQTSLRQHFNSLTLGGRSFQYKNKRERKTKSGAIAIGMEEFAKTVHAFLYGPADYYGGTKYLFDNSVGQGYCKVFGDGTSVWDRVEKIEFARLCGAWFICKVVQEWLVDIKKDMLKRERELTDAGVQEDASVKNALERKWLIYFAVGQAFEWKCKGEDKDFARQLRRLGNPHWTEDSGAVACVREIAEFSCELLLRLYRSESKSREFTHRNWYRDDTTIKRVITEVASSMSTIRKLKLP
jgi:hypothetical protein